MKKSIFFLSIFLVLVVVLRSLAHAEEKVFYPCYRLKKEPVLDGRLKGGSAWENIPSASGFVKAGSTSLASKQTFLKIGYSLKALYIGIECRELEVEKIEAKLKDMENLWTEDSVEIFLFPRGADNYYQFIVNAIGSRWNGRGLGGPKMPLGNWQAKTYQGENYWSVEIKIPFEIFNRRPEKNEVWTGNFCRNIYISGHEGTSWAAVKSNFHEPENFGTIIFEDKTLSIKEAGKIEDRLSLPLKNLLKKEIQRRMELISDLESELVVTKNPVFEKKVSALFKKCKGIKNSLSSFLNTLSLDEIDLLLKESKKLLKEANELRVEILLNGLLE